MALPLTFAGIGSKFLPLKNKQEKIYLLYPFVIFSLRSISSKLHSENCTKVFKIFIFCALANLFNFWNKNNLPNYQTVTHYT